MAEVKGSGALPTFQMKSKDQIAEEEFRAKKVADRAAALKGLKFPLIVIATGDGQYADQRIRKGKTFLVKEAAKYAPSWMKPAPAGAADMLAGVTTLVRRGNRRTSRDLPSLTEGLDDQHGTLETPVKPGEKSSANESVLG